MYARVCLCSSTNNCLYCFFPALKTDLDNMVLRIERCIQKQNSDLQTMFVNMNAVFDDFVKHNIPCEKFNELKTTVDCLVQSSVSPDILRDIRVMTDAVVSNSGLVKNSSGANIDRTKKILDEKLTQIYKKMLTMDELCNDTKQSLDDLKSEINISQQAISLTIIEEIRRNNEICMKDISEHDYLTLSLLKNRPSK